MSLPAHPSALALDAVLVTELGCTVDYPFGEDIRIYRTAERIVAVLHESSQPPRMTFKGHPLDNAQLCRDFPAITPGYHMNKKHWITILLDGTVPEALIEEIAAASNDLILAALTRAQRAAWLARPTE